MVEVGSLDEALVGHYYLSGVMETGSELLLKADGQFEWFISYGAVDQMAKGRWGRSGEIVTLAVDPQAKDSASVDNATICCLRLSTSGCYGSIRAV
jgi:hypothetical protein